MKTNTQQAGNIFQLDIKKRSDRWMDYFLVSFFISGLFLASYYGTWSMALAVGGICLLSYYSTKLLLPASNLYQYVLSVVLAIFMAQYIYQMHGMFEMHFLLLSPAPFLLLTRTGNCSCHW